MPAAFAAMEILLRACLGILDDLSWRFEAIRASRADPLERRGTMIAPSERQIRWMGLCLLLGGLLQAADLIYFPHNDPSNALRGYLHVPADLLVIAGLTGLWAQQRARLGKAGMAGLVLLFTSFVGFFVLNLLGLFGLRGETLLANVLGLAAVLVLPPGLLLVAIGLKGPARVVAIAILGLWLVGALLPSSTKAMLTNYFGGWDPVPGFLVLAIGVAVMGYFVFRNPAAGYAAHH
ncbi:MAG TPA: hypothetical protein VNL98_02390 [Gemmatimonadales bacterium]|nr:hypothetical protein [Gemmatimonadales bacterium]